MSRSKHITRKEAFQRFVDGDIEAASEYAEKHDLKAEYKKHRIYMAQIDDGVQRFTISNAAFLSILKRFNRAHK